MSTPLTFKLPSSDINNFKNFINDLYSPNKQIDSLIINPLIEDIANNIDVEELYNPSDNLLLLGMFHNVNNFTLQVSSHRSHKRF